jgi:hypothetical protein
VFSGCVAREPRCPITATRRRDGITGSTMVTRETLPR